MILNGKFNNLNDFLKPENIQFTIEIFQCIVVHWWRLPLDKYH